jgi:peptidoglycan LD-endopeptidase LytH
MNLSELLREHKENFHPIFNPDLTLNNTLMMDFSSDNPEMTLLEFDNLHDLNDFVFNKIHIAGRVYGYGGYLEDRNLYRRSKVFEVSEGQSRSIHLGIDVWAEAGKPVYGPLEAKVHSFQNNGNYGDYGPTIILEHEIEGIHFYTLYGHLSVDSQEGLYPGKHFGKGELLCRIGNFPVNGDWPPHLHFQVIADMGDKKGDFPGVCAKDDLEFFKNLCPDPVVFFNF